MKKIHIFGIIVIAAAIFIIIVSAGDASQYVNFDEAYALAQNGNTKKIHVVGELKKDEKGNILGMEYNIENPNYFAFTMVDDKNREEKVVFYDAKPADFERSEQIVVVGNVQNNQFVADKILMKCPSKYEENTLEIKEAEAKN